MFMTGLAGFIAGMILGAILNRYLLRRVPVAEWRRNRDLKLRYGALNWGIAIVGAIIAVYIRKLTSVW